MPKVTNLRNLVKAAIGALTVLQVCASCVYDTYMDAPDDNATTVNVGFTFRTGNVSSGEGYEVGSTYENYIDLDNKDYRIYFFTNNTGNEGNDTFVSRFVPQNIAKSYGSDYTDYVLSGEVELTDEMDYSSFKIMVLANWGTSQYGDGDFTTSTTINDVCTSATFSAFVDESNNALLPTDDRRIPFYGIHAYSGISLEAGKMVWLQEPITLLRAMAKVEVILESTDVSFSSVKVQRYNSTGYCAPDGVYSQSNYGQGTDWSTDYLTGVHLVNGYNDGNGTPTDRSISFYDTNNDGRTWVAYLPEYDNTSSTGDYSYITLEVEGDNNSPYTIYFAKYAYGETVNDVTYRFDIQRNNLYRYTVEFLGNQGLNVHVDKWSEEYENRYEFGTDESDDTTD